MKAVAFLVIGAAWCSAIWGCVYLAMHGHPWIGLVVLVLGLCVESGSPVAR